MAAERGLGWTTRLNDFVLGIVSPKRQALRQHYRRLQSGDEPYRIAYEIGLRQRGYKAASHSKSHTSWPGASPRSADGEIVGDLYTMRNRSRAANRDDPLSSGITGTFVRGVVGTGLRPQARTGDEVKDEALESVWNDRKDQLSRGEGNLIHGMVQRLRYGKRVEDGEIFLTPACEAPGQPIWISNIEADRVRTPADAMPKDPAGRIVDGVEKDGMGRVVAYWVLQKHPGDHPTFDTKHGAKAKTNVSVFAKEYFDRLPEERVCHDRSRVTRPGQTRGVPTGHAIMQDLRDLDLFIFASLRKAQVAACLAAFITSSSATTDLFDLTAEDYGYELDQKLEPGMIFRLFPQESVEFLTPGASPGIQEFIMMLASRIGAGIGLSPQAVLRRWEGVSYSGARTIKIDDRQTYRAERADFGGHALSWEWRQVHEDELLRGNEKLHAAGVTIEDLKLVDWIGDEEPWVDPNAEASAVEIMLRLGLTSPQIECARLGRDYLTVLKDNLTAQVAERDMRAKLGLPPPAMHAPPKSAVGGEIPADQAPGEAANEDAKKKPGDDSNPANDDATSAKVVMATLIRLRELDVAAPAPISHHHYQFDVAAPAVSLRAGDVIVPKPDPIRFSPTFSPSFAPEFKPTFAPRQDAQAAPSVTVTPEITAKVSLPERKHTFKHANGELVTATSKDA